MFGHLISSEELADTWASADTLLDATLA